MVDLITSYGSFGPCALAPACGQIDIVGLLASIVDLRRSLPQRIHHDSERRQVLMPARVIDVIARETR